MQEDETPEGGRPVFDAVARSETDIAALIRHTLETLGRTSDTELTAFTDGCSSLRSILADAGVTSVPILDWFPIAVRLQHAKQAAGGLPADDAGACTFYGRWPPVPNLAVSAAAVPGGCAAATSWPSSFSAASRSLAARSASKRSRWYSRRPSHQPGGGGYLEPKDDAL